MLLTRRQAVQAGLAAGVGVALAGCGTTTPSPSKETPKSAAAGPVTITYATWGEEIEIQITKALVDRFHALNAGTRVDLQVLPHKDFDTQLETRMTGDTTPDVFRQVYSKFGRYGSAGAVLELDSYAGNLKEQFADGLWTAVQYNGKLVGIPAITDNVGIFYNVDYATKAGVKPPTRIEDAWTWEQFVAAGAAMQKSGAKYGFTSWGRHPKSWLAFLHQNGGTLFTADGKAPAIQEDAAVKAIEKSVKVIKDGLEPISAFWKKADDTDQLFVQGKTGMDIGGMWMIPFFDKNIKDFKYGVTYVTKGPGGLTSDFGGSGLGVSARTKHPKEAWSFLAFMTGEEAMTKYCAEGYFIPPRKKIAAEIKYPSHQEELRYFVEQNLKLSPALVRDYTNPKYPECEVILKEELELAVLGRKTPKQAASDAAGRFKKALES